MIAFLSSIGIIVGVVVHDCARNLDERVRYLPARYPNPNKNATCFVKLAIINDCAPLALCLNAED